MDFPLFPSSPARFFRILGQKWVRHSAPAPTLSTACMDCSVVCKELVGGVEGYSKVGTDVGDASIAGLSGEAVITVTEVPAVDGAVSQSDGQHGVVPILTQIRILDEGAASRQLPSGEALWVEGAILLQKVQVYILGEGAAAEEGVVHGDGEGHTVLRESHLGIGDLAVGGHEVATVRQGREGHSEAACIDLGGADGLPAALHPHGIALPSPGPVDFRATNAGRNIGIIASVAALLIVEKAQCGQLHAWKTGDAVIDVRPASDHPDGCLGLDLAPKQGRIQPQHPAADTALTVDPVQAGAGIICSQLHQEVTLVRLDGGDEVRVVPIESPNLRLRGDGAEDVRLRRPGGRGDIAGGPGGTGGGTIPAGGKVHQQEDHQSQRDEFLHGIALPFCCSGRGPGEELAIASGNLTA